MANFPCLRMLALYMSPGKPQRLCPIVKLVRRRLFAVHQRIRPCYQVGRDFAGLNIVPLNDLPRG